MKFSEFTPGQVIEAGPYQLTEEALLGFAREWDPQWFHTDPAAATQGRFGGLIASGWQTCGIAMRLAVQAALQGSESFASPGVEKIRWPHPVRAGDTLRLRAIDAAGLEGAAADVDFSLQARPEPPFIRLPAPDAVVYAPGLELGWTLNAEAPRVRLQIARDAAFQDLVQQPPPIAGASHGASLPPGVYHWRIASVAGERAGPFGDAQRFELREPPPAPPPATPAVNGNQLDLRWPAVSGVVGYELEWATNAGFEGAVTHKTDKPELTLPKPAPGRYYLRARSRNADGINSPWGQTQLIDQPEEPLRWPWLILVPVVLHVLL